jgi:hypothetical protein
MVDPARLDRLLDVMHLGVMHGYADVDDQRVLEILRSGPEDLQTYRRAIANLSE